MIARRLPRGNLAASFGVAPSGQPFALAICTVGIRSFLGVGKVGLGPKVALSGSLALSPSALSAAPSRPPRRDSVVGLCMRSSFSAAITRSFSHRSVAGEFSPSSRIVPICWGGLPGELGGVSSLLKVSAVGAIGGHRERASTTRAETNSRQGTCKRVQHRQLEPLRVRSCEERHVVSKPGLHDCYSFVDAAAFFGISRRQAIGLFCGNGLLVSPNAVIKGIDGLLRAHEAAEQVPALSWGSPREASVQRSDRACHLKARAALKSARPCGLEIRQWVGALSRKALQRAPNRLRGINVATACPVLTPTRACPSLAPSDRSRLPTHVVVDGGRAAACDGASGVAAHVIVESGATTGVGDRATDIAAHRVPISAVLNLRQRTGRREPHQYDGDHRCADPGVDPPPHGSCVAGSKHERGAARAGPRKAASRERLSARPARLAAGGSAASCISFSRPPARSPPDRKNLRISSRKDWLWLAKRRCC